MIRSGSFTFRISRQRLVMKLLSKRITVSTSTVTRSPGATCFSPPFFARIFSAIVIPLVARPSGKSFFERVELGNSHQFVDYMEGSEQIGANDDVVLPDDLRHEYLHGVH